MLGILAVSCAQIKFRYKCKPDSEQYGDHYVFWNWFQMLAIVWNPVYSHGNQNIFEFYVVVLSFYLHVLTLWVTQFYFFLFINNSITNKICLICLLFYWNVNFFFCYSVFYSFAIPLFYYHFFFLFSSNSTNFDLFTCRFTCFMHNECTLYCIVLHCYSTIFNLSVHPSTSVVYLFVYLLVYYVFVNCNT